MNFLHYLLSSLRSLLFKWTFGIDHQVVIDIGKRHKIIMDILDDHHESIHILGQALTKLHDQSGGPGWPETIQLAIGQLNEKIDYHRKILQLHQDNIAELIQFETKESIALDSKKDLN
jgi:hypothetical protein